MGRLRTGAPSAALAGLMLVGGCYLSHGLEGGRDGGRPGETDVGRTVPPLPDDEPDVAPGERPSDDPASSGWLDPPRFGSGPCCDVGEVVGLDDIERQASPPRVAWDGVAWGLTWGDQVPGEGRLVFRGLSPRADLLGELRIVDPHGKPATAMAYGNHRFAVVTGNWFRGTDPARLLVLDRDGMLRTAADLSGAIESVAITRHAMVHGWATVDGTRGLLLVHDEDLRETVRRSLGWSPGERGTAVVSIKSALVVGSGTPETTIQTFRDASMEAVATLAVGSLGTELVGVAFRDSVVIAGRVYGAGQLRTLVWDPFGRSVLSPLQAIADTPSGQGLGLAADSEGGTLALCYPSGGSESRNADGVTFLLIGGDGAPLAEPVVLASGFDYVASCAVGAASRDSYAVVWWNAAWDSPRHSILATVVTVRR